MSTALAGAVELLDRSLGYTRVVLADVAERDLDLPTPCRGWLLRDLLDHMDDSLDAFLEAAGGQVELEVGRSDPAQMRVDRLQAKACHLLGAWAHPEQSGGVAIGGVDLASDVLVAMAALEVTVHGWDVGATLGAAVGAPASIPDALAAELHRVAQLVVGPVDRGRRFAAPLTGPVPHDGGGGSDSARLLRWLGRRPDWTAR